MFPLEQGALEFAVIGVFALIVLGPEKMPILLRRLGQFTAKMRGMAAEFRASFDELARQSELDELRKEVEALRSGKLGLEDTSSPSTTPASYDYNPFDNAPSGLDNHGFSFPPQPTVVDAPAVTEAATEVEAPAKPARKPRVKKAEAIADFAPADPVPVKPYKSQFDSEATPESKPKPRAKAKRAPQSEDAGG